ncbi:MAG: LysM peptidoglycan-binding domain-containing protein [Myxococcales bacterium]|nr:LysM peptidoglycan-binding domain-containing protein [Myxococcales bacterium]
MILYTVRPGDYLVKIAAEHGTTWQAIWDHPSNAELRRRRGSPDILYPGDVLAIETPLEPGAPAGPPPEAPAPPTAPVPPASGAPTWPYEDDPSDDGEPNWDCPDGTCVCHGPAEDETPRPHVLVLYDGHGLRMPNARVRVYEHGRLITAEPAQASASGEVELTLRASTKTLRVLWAPADAPQRQELPYRRRYHVDLGSDASQRALRRLSNLGFGEGRSRAENVRDYQRVYDEPQTGRPSDVAAEVRARHDQGALPPFPPDPKLGPSLSSPDTSPHFVAAMRYSAKPPQPAPAAPGDDAAPPAGGGGASYADGPTSMGSVVPAVGNVVVFVADLSMQPPVAPVVTVRLRRVVSGTREVREPSHPYLPLPTGVTVCSFEGVPVGTWEVTASSDGKTGRASVDVNTGEWEWVGVDIRRRLRLSIFDFTPWFAGNQRPDLTPFGEAHVDDYSLVHTVIPKFDFNQHGPPWPLNVPDEVEWDGEYFRPLGSPYPKDQERYLRTLVDDIHARGGQVFVGYALVKGAKNANQQLAFPAWLARSDPAPDVAGHARKIVDFFFSAQREGGPIDIDGIVFDIEIGAISEQAHGPNLRALIRETAVKLAEVKPDGVVGYYTGIFHSRGEVGASMEPFTYTFAMERDNLLARTMGFGAAGEDNGTILTSVDWGLTNQVQPSRIQVATSEATGKTDMAKLVPELAKRNVGLAIMNVAGHLGQAKMWDAVLNPGATGPGLAGNPLHVPLKTDRG